MFVRLLILACFVCFRQAVVRTLQSSLRAVGGARDEAERLLCVATQLSQDVGE